MPDENNVSHFICTKNQLDTTEIQSGAIYLSPDEQLMHFDYDERRKLGDVIDIDTETAMKALTSPKSKFYYCKDTGNLWRRLNGEWQIMGGPSSLNSVTAKFKQARLMMRLSIINYNRALTNGVGSPKIEIYALEPITGKYDVQGQIKEMVQNRFFNSITVYLCKAFTNKSKVTVELTSPNDKLIPAYSKTYDKSTGVGTVGVLCEVPLYQIIGGSDESDVLNDYINLNLLITNINSNGTSSDTLSKNFTPITTSLSDALKGDYLAIVIIRYTSVDS